MKSVKSFYQTWCKFTNSMSKVNLRKEFEMKMVENLQGTELQHESFDEKQIENMGFSRRPQKPWRC